MTTAKMGTIKLQHFDSGETGLIQVSEVYFLTLSSCGEFSFVKEPEEGSQFMIFRILRPFLFTLDPSWTFSDRSFCDETVDDDRDSYNVVDEEMFSDKTAYIFEIESVPPGDAVQHRIAQRVASIQPS